MTDPVARDEILARLRRQHQPKPRPAWYVTQAGTRFTVAGDEYLFLVPGFVDGWDLWRVRKALNSGKPVLGEDLGGLVESAAMWHGEELAKRHPSGPVDVAQASIRIDGLVQMIAETRAKAKGAA